MRVATTAERLRQVMSEYEMQAVELAKRADISKSALSRYLSGEYEPGQGAMYKMAIALDVSEMWLWGYDVPRERTVQQKQNDDLIEITVRLRKDVSFFDTVKSLSHLSVDDFETIRKLVSVLDNQ